MRKGGLHGGNFVVVHARFSAEKKKERGSGLPHLEAYLASVELVMQRANTSKLFLQTSTPAAVELFERWSRCVCGGRAFLCTRDLVLARGA